MPPLALSRCGAGAPLVLLHGLGSARSVWEPVIPALAAHFDVLALDLPGFGDSTPLPPGVEPDPSALARSVAAALDGWGIDRPHVVGNSLGGWIALQLAEIRPVASLTLLSPAGLWAGNLPAYCRISLRATRWLARHAEPLAFRLSDRRLGRAVLFAQTHGRPTQLSPAAARLAVRAMGTSPGFDLTLRATATRSYRSMRPLDTSVTLAFGSRDRLLLRRQSRHLDQLPQHLSVPDLPGCGHVPMSDDSDAVARLIIDAVAHAGEAAPRAILS